jgi:hypothetical protein
MPPRIPKPILLVITAGVTDLQPLVNTDDGRRLRATIKRNNRLFHEALLAALRAGSPARISVDAADETRDETDLNLPNPEGGAAPIFDPERPLWLDAEQQHCIDFVREGEALVLVAPQTRQCLATAQGNGDAAGGRASCSLPAVTPVPASAPRSQ